MHNIIFKVMKETKFNDVLLKIKEIAFFFKKNP